MTSTYGSDEPTAQALADADDAQTIDLTPTDEGFEIMLERFCASTRSDFTKPRRNDASHILSSIVEIAFYLGAKHPGDVDLRARLIAAAKGNAS